MSVAALADLLVRVIHADCIEAMEAMEAESIDAIVTDPPYGLGFMGMGFDKLGAPAQQREFHRRWAVAALRVLKPGGHLIAFGGTRTYHHLAAGVEEAGFEIRDMVSWAYGSGFPKSLDVGKAIDKRGGCIADFCAFRDAVKATMREKGISRRQVSAALGNQMLSHYLTANSQPQVPNIRDYAIIRDLVGLGSAFDSLFLPEAERVVVGEKLSGIGERGGPRRHTVGAGRTVAVPITAPHTEAAQAWHGWGTALKPAVEPAVLARKPMVGTVAANVLTFGTGALNVDGCRVGTEGGTTRSGQAAYPRNEDGSEDRSRSWARTGHSISPVDAGRWPANLIHDGSDDVVGLFPAKAGACARASGPTLTGGSSSVARGRFNGLDRPATFHADTGSAARFFYCAKAGPSERPDVMVCGCLAGALPMRRDGPEAEQPCPTCGKPAKRLAHPTVKPVALMEYLIRMVLPPGGVVLDPFAGSGSTLVAAQRMGVAAIGIEKEAEYVVIARTRLQP